MNPTKVAGKSFHGVQGAGGFRTGSFLGWAEHGKGLLGQQKPIGPVASSPTPVPPPDTAAGTEALDSSPQRLETAEAPAVSAQREYPLYEFDEPVALFVPCYIDEFYPQIAQATAELLSWLQVPVEFPSRQTCCGQPAFNSGYWKEARKVVHHFCQTFASYRWIVCPSGSCAAMCRVFFGQLEPDPRIVEIGQRVYELTEFLVECMGVRDVGARFPHKVTLHIGCHTRRELGVVDPPRELLRSVEGLQYVELPDMEECCGFGGTFSVKMPGTSIAMGQTKAENIIRSGAEVVVSPDISCLMHLGGILRRHPQGRKIRCMHIAELLVAEE